MTFSNFTSKSLVRTNVSWQTARFPTIFFFGKQKSRLIIHRMKLRAGGNDTEMYKKYVHFTKSKSQVYKRFSYLFSWLAFSQPQKKLLKRASQNLSFMHLWRHFPKQETYSLCCRKKIKQRWRILIFLFENGHTDLFCVHDSHTKSTRVFYITKLLMAKLSLLHPCFLLPQQ